jgi:hypothetical protein
MFSIFPNHIKVKRLRWFCFVVLKTVFQFFKMIVLGVTLGNGMPGNLAVQAAPVCTLMDRPVNAAQRDGCCTEVRVWYAQSYCHSGNQGAEMNAPQCHLYPGTEQYRYKINFSVGPEGDLNWIYPQGEYQRNMATLYEACTSCCGADNACLCNCALSNPKLIFNAGLNGGYTGGIHLNLSWGARYLNDDVQPGFPVWGNPFANPKTVINKQQLSGSKGVHFSQACSAVQPVKIKMPD